MALSPPKEQQHLWHTVTGRAGAANPFLLWWRRYAGLLVSEGHHRSRKTGFWVEGGPFYCVKTSRLHYGGLDFLFGRTALGITPALYRVEGVATGTSNVAAQPAINSVPWSLKESELQYYDPIGFERTRPGNPEASMGQFLAELRDIPSIPGATFKRSFRGIGRGVPLERVPRVLKDRLAWYRSLGSEYLNVQFGWVPFVRDLQQMYELWRTIDRQIAQLKRENGKGIRRKATLEADETVSQAPPTSQATPMASVYGRPSNWPTGLGGKSLTTVTTHTQTNVWYVAKYSYYIPDIDSSEWDTRARAALFGVLPTPDLLWQVIPWTWLIGWFSNVGAITSNVSPNAVDNLTRHYSFIMKRERKTITAQCASSWPAGRTSLGETWASGDHTWTTIERSDVKTRVGGSNPYGLSVQLPSLSSYQLSILAALGISRSRVR